MTRKFYSAVLTLWADDGDLNSFVYFSAPQKAIAQEILTLRYHQLRRLPKSRLEELCRKGPYGHLTSDEWNALRERIVQEERANRVLQWL